MIINVFTDGGSKGNPGPSAIGVYATFGNKRLIVYREDLGVKTNNEAEYTAIMRACEKLNALGLINLGAKKIVFHADSMLVVEQLSGRWKVKEERLRIFVDEVKSLLTQLPLPYQLTYVPREKNKIADGLVNGVFPA